MKILLAEDDPVSCMALESIAAPLGLEPIIATTGTEALAYLTSDDPPPVAVLDWMMPGVDGLDVCRAVRRAALPIEPYLLMLTARTAHQDIVSGLRAGADDYVAKPFSRVELEARIQVGLRLVGVQLQLRERVRDLEESQARERTLRRLLPICAYCRKIRDDQNYWQMLEHYVSETAGVQFSHGVCPDCIGQVEQELAAIRGAQLRRET
jgi:DNA-binding response OmpR family regulator